MSQELMQALEIHAKLFGLTKGEAKEDAEGIIRGMMENEGYTREFAEATFIEDTLDTDPQAIAELEAKAKENTKQHRAKRAPADYSLEGKPKRERKPNEDKRALIALLASCLEDCHRRDEDEPVTGVGDVQTVNPERQVDFTLNGVHYSVTLTAHRKPKEGKA